MNKILLVEDQKEFQLLIGRIIKDGQHQVYFADSAEQAKTMMAKERFDLILLDITLPEQNGLDLYCEMQNTPDLAGIPVIFLTGTESVTTKVTAFSLGAEDYISKKFDPAELKARVHAKVRKSRNRSNNQDEQSLGPFKFNLPAQRAYTAVDMKELDLTAKEFKFLYLLAKNPDVIMNREKILNNIWGEGKFVTDRSVDTYVYQLRKKLGPLGNHIESISGEGYRFTTNPKNEIKKAA